MVQIKWMPLILLYLQGYNEAVDSKMNEHISAEVKTWGRGHVLLYGTLFLQKKYYILVTIY